MTAERLEYEDRPIRPGDILVVTDAYGEEHRAKALSKVITHEGPWGSRKRKWPLIWVGFSKPDREPFKMPWPADSVRLESN